VALARAAAAPASVADANKDEGRDSSIDLRREPMNSRKAPKQWLIERR
jgi:hypothetical protein